jgi:hypothetical protein
MYKDDLKLGKKPNLDSWERVYWKEGLMPKLTAK